MLTKDTRVILGIPCFNKGVIILRIYWGLFSKWNVILSIPGITRYPYLGIPGITLVSLLSILRINSKDTKKIPGILSKDTEEFLVCLLRILGLY